MVAVNNVSAIDNQQKPNRAKKFAYVAAGAAIGWESKFLLEKAAAYPLGRCFGKFRASIQGGEYRPYIEELVKQPRMAHHKLKVYDFNENTLSQIKKDLKISTGKMPLKMRIKNHLLQKSYNLDAAMLSIARGNNAMALSRKKVALCNLDKLSVTAFHELGHLTHVWGANPAMQLLYASKSITHYLMLGVTAAAMLINPNQEKEHSFDMDPFIKKHCGVIAALTSLPNVAEETLANIDAIKLAKSVGVKGDMMKKVKKSAVISTGSYVLGAVVTGVAVQAASKLRDIIVARGKK